MLNTVQAVVRDGKIEPIEPVDLPEGATVLVTLLVQDDGLFWSEVSRAALNRIWDNVEDDVYAELLKK